MEQKLFKALGEAINETLSNSDRIASVLERVRAEGYDTYIVCEVTVGLKPIEEPEPETPVAEPKFTEEDQELLKNFRIKL